MIPTRQAFLQAIIANPDEDTPRLVFADWLEENGDPTRAEFIRRQCRSTSRRRVAELLRRHETSWATGLRSLGSWEFRRGFVEAVSTTRLRFRRHAESCFRQHPIRSVSFLPLMYREDTPEQMRRFVTWLTAWQPLQRVEEMRWQGHSAGGVVSIDVPSLTILLRSPYLGRLRRLSIEDNVDLAGAGAVLAESPVLGGLTSLALSLVEGADIVALARSRFVPSLHTLALRYVDISGQDFAALAGWRGLAGLTELNLAGTQLQPRAAGLLAATPHLPAVTKLFLNRCNVGDLGLQRLVELRKLSRAEVLDLEENHLSADAAPWLSRLSCLTRLNLRGNRLGPTGARGLAEAEGLSGLRELNIGLNQIGDDGLTALANSPRLRNLRILTAYANNISDAGVQALAASPTLSRVVKLRLGGNHDISDAGAKALAESPYLGRLRLLDLPATRIGSAGIQLLQQRFGSNVDLRSLTDPIVGLSE